MEITARNEINLKQSINFYQNQSTRILQISTQGQYQTNLKIYDQFFLYKKIN